MTFFIEYKIKDSNQLSKINFLNLTFSIAKMFSVIDSVVISETSSEVSFLYLLTVLAARRSVCILTKSAVAVNSS